jgi:hypothetical protein
MAALIQSLTIQKFVCGDVDAQHKLVAKDCLGQSIPNRGADDLGPLALHRSSCSGRGLTGQAIQWWDRTVILQHGRHVGVHVAVSVSLCQPAQHHQLSRGE